MSGTRRKPGRLGPYVDGYRARLLELGYTRGTVRGQLKVLGQLGRWMASEGRDVEQLNFSTVDAFLKARRNDGHRRVSTERSFKALLDYLHDQGVTEEPAPPAAPSPLDALVGRYREWMIRERSLAPATVLRYERVARRFFTRRRSREDELAIKDLTGADVTAFLLQECGRVSLGAAKGRVAELRSVLRFLYARGLTTMSLATAVPPVAGWHDTSLPVSMEPSDIQRLLASCDRSNVAGARDFAILTLLARLGLRSVEVASLEFEDLDWRAGEIVVRGKVRRQDRLPLPDDVGEAVVAYLSRRDRGITRRVFLTINPPRRPILPALVGDVVERACRRTGLPPVGAHRLRHALATEMLRQGAALIDISQVLRHQDLATTAVYAKVDLGRLRQVAQAWPGAVR